MMYVQIEIYLMYFWNLERLQMGFFEKTFDEYFYLQFSPFFARKNQKCSKHHMYPIGKSSFYS